MKPPAYFDTSTGKIMNAKKNTLIYFHEEGHKKWFREGKEQMMELMSKEILFMMLPVAVLYATKNLLLTFISAIPFFLDMLSETHAWTFAILKWLRKRK